MRSTASRFARGQAPEGLDKEYVRRFLADKGFRGDGPIPEIPDSVKVEASRRYLTAVERITGQSFEPDLSEPLSRIQKNVDSYLGA